MEGIASFHSGRMEALDCKEEQCLGNSSGLSCFERKHCFPCAGLGRNFQRLLRKCFLQGAILGRKPASSLGFRKSSFRSGSKALALDSSPGVALCRRLPALAAFLEAAFAGCTAAGLNLP